MGSTCKCEFRRTETLESEITYLSKNKHFKQQKKLNDQPTMACLMSNVRAFYIIYPKKNENLISLQQHLQDLNKQNEYEIEECFELISENSYHNVESCFNINGISYGSFKLINPSSEKEFQ
ncbi:unnamed protein product [Paramecium primaurelia]|uniref:Uncharacterized protein n=1 Tax=Paramecium primaurelia TaxID=5886 RepID=A0A8S1PLS5_PARPR|nr:unnamed protein product [Paramecium primaurelia]